MTTQSVYYPQNLVFDHQNYAPNAPPFLPTIAVHPRPNTPPVSTPSSSVTLASVHLETKGATGVSDATNRSTRHCTVKNCNAEIPEESPNKMCVVCRGRHRIYATTKRARRKVEKAAIIAGMGPDNWVAPAQSPPEPQVQQAVIASMPTTSLNPDNVSQRPSALPTPAVATFKHMSTWDHTIVDSRLFASQSSELAGALTLPTPTVAYEISSDVDSSSLQPDSTLEESTPGSASAKPLTVSSNSSSVLDPITDSSLSLVLNSSSPPRYCSVKGCKAIIPGDYFYKMCEPCRDRYRIYGITKRAKWKRERVSNNAELGALRKAEDKRRQEAGLKPLTECPEDLNAWESSIANEQTGVQSATGLDPSPFSHPSDPTNIILPVRMCTVSHCHKILPGSYRYRRCDQHRLQNRHHSQLKRVREKQVKSIGPSVDGQDRSQTDTSAESESDNTAQEKKRKASKEKPPIPESLFIQHAAVLDAEGNLITKTTLSPAQRGIRRSTHTCSMKNCENLLSPDVPWKMCDVCRIRERKQRKVQRTKAKEESEQIDSVRLEVESGHASQAVGYDSESSKSDSDDQDMQEELDSSSIIAPADVVREVTSASERNENVHLHSAGRELGGATPTLTSSLQTAPPNPIPVGRRTPKNTDGSTNNFVFKDPIVPNQESKDQETNIAVPLPGLMTDNNLASKFAPYFVPSVPVSSSFIYQPTTHKTAGTKRSTQVDTANKSSSIPASVSPSQLTATSPSASANRESSLSTTTTITSSLSQTTARASTSSTPQSTATSNKLKHKATAGEVTTASPSASNSVNPYLAQLPQYAIPYYIPSPYGLPAYALPLPFPSEGIQSAPYLYPPLPYGYPPQYASLPYPYVPSLPPVSSFPSVASHFLYTSSTSASNREKWRPRTTPGIVYNHFIPPGSKGENPRKRKRSPDKLGSIASEKSQIVTNNNPLTFEVRSNAPASADVSPEKEELNCPYDQLISVTTSKVALVQGSEMQHSPSQAVPKQSRVVPVTRTCSNTSCRRTLPDHLTGSICGRCKSLLKKRQVKTRKRLRLEPRQMVACGNKKSK